MKSQMTILAALAASVAVVSVVRAEHCLDPYRRP